MGQPEKPWAELTADEKADLVHKENRQLYDLINEQARQIQALTNDLNKVKGTL